MRDCALLLQGLAGYDPDDPFSADLPVPDFTADLEKGVKGLKLAVCPDLIDVDIDKPIADAFDAAVEVLRGLGAAVEEVKCSFANEHFTSSTAAPSPRNTSTAASKASAIGLSISTSIRSGQTASFKPFTPFSRSAVKSGTGKSAEKGSSGS